MKDLKKIINQLWGNKTTRLLIIIFGGALFLFFFGSMTYSWIFIVLIVILIIVYFVSMMKKELDQSGNSKLELINRLNGEKTLYLEAASLIEGEKDVIGAIALTEMRIFFISKLGSNEPIVVDIPLKNIKGFGESNFLRLETLDGKSYGFKVNDLKYLKEMIAKLINIVYVPSKSTILEAKELITQVADMVKSPLPSDTEKDVKGESLVVDGNDEEENKDEINNKDNI